MTLSNEDLTNRVENLEADFKEIKAFVNEKEEKLNKWAKNTLTSSRLEKKEDMISIDDI